MQFTQPGILAPLPVVGRYVFFSLQGDAAALRTALAQLRSHADGARTVVAIGTPEQVAAQARAVLDSFGKPHTDKTTTGPTHIFNLGHGISQFTPPEHVAALVEAVHSHSRTLRQA